MFSKFSKCVDVLNGYEVTVELTYKVQIKIFFYQIKNGLKSRFTVPLTLDSLPIVGVGGDGGDSHEEHGHHDIGLHTNSKINIWTRVTKKGQVLCFVYH